MPEFEECKNTMRDDYLHIGDRVKFSDSAPLEYARCLKITKDTIGVITGFIQIKEYVTWSAMWINSDKRIPGIYVSNSSPCVSWGDNITAVMMSSSLQFEDSAILESRIKDIEYRDIFNISTYQEHLPWTEYNIGDCVWLRVDGDANVPIPVVLIWIDYEPNCCSYNPITKNGSVVYLYRTEIRGEVKHCTADEVVGLVSRGNYWAWENDKAQLSFGGVREEASFYRTLGYGEQVRNLNASSLEWHKDEFVRALKNGAVDCSSEEVGFMEGSALETFMPWRFKDLPDLSARLRKYTLARITGNLE